MSNGRPLSAEQFSGELLYVDGINNTNPNNRYATVTGVLGNVFTNIYQREWRHQ